MPRGQNNKAAADGVVATHTTNDQVTRAVADIVFRKDLYPRIETNQRTVDQYAEDLAVLPPIEINQHNELIDGWHRWTAHRKAGAELIAVMVTETASESELLELAICRNAAHGLQLSLEDKQNMARRIYNGTAERQREGKKAELARILSVSERTVHNWLSRIDKDAKAARDKRIFDLWLACHTQQEIADVEGMDQGTVSRLIDDFMQIGNLSVSHKAAAEHAVDFEVPIYNVWKQQEKTPGASHFGNTEVRWLDNLIYLYTRPFDVVVDPFAGGGSTIDICRKRMRRYWVSDRKPAVGREDVIRQHDMTQGLPKVPRWTDVRLVYLDPPYWRQAEGRYSDEPADLANMDLAHFTDTLASVVSRFAQKLSDGWIALVLQPTQWNAPDRQFTDHIADMIRTVRLPIVQRISVPYESQQANPQMVEWAKENRQLLVLTREIVVWKTSQ